MSQGRSRGGVLCAVLAALAVALPGSAFAAPSVAGALHRAAAPAAQLQRVATDAAPGGTGFIRFQQTVGGVPVLGAQTVVLDEPSAAPFVVSDSTRPGLSASTTPKVTRGRALAIARRDTGARALRGPATANLAVDPTGDGALVWRVVLPSGRPVADYEVLVDALTGSVVARHDLLQHLTGQAMLYDPNPVAEQGGSAAGLSDNHDADSALLTSLREARTLPRLKKGQDCLVGRYAMALLYKTGDPVCRRSLDWSDVTRSQDAFEALMAYYHVDRTQEYIQRLGFNRVDNRRQVLLADSLTDDNSFYSPATKKISYGTGGVDDAEDGDVIIHEYGHSIQDNQVPGFGSGNQAGAIGEGWGDYLSATMTYQSDGLPAGTYDQSAACIFDWDGTLWGDAGPCGRHADTTSTLRHAQLVCGGEIHCVGQVWSGTLLDLRSALGGEVLDRDVIASQFGYVADEKFRQAAHDLECADEANYPAGQAGDCVGAHYSAIHAEMQARGIQ